MTKLDKAALIVSLYLPMAIALFYIAGRVALIEYRTKWIIEEIIIRGDW